MKLKLLASLMAVALGGVPAALSQPSDIWQNDAVVIVPSTSYPFSPAIDALTFFNTRQGTFNITLSDGSLFSEWSDVLNFTNKGLMSGFSGFDFQTFPLSQPAHMAANFANIASGTNGGVINCRSFAYTPFYGLAECLVSATNILNSGSINLSASQKIKLTGKNVDLTRGALTMANPSDNPIAGSAGQLDGYWGTDAANDPAPGCGGGAVAAPVLFPSSLRNGFTPSHLVTNRNYQLCTYQQLRLSNPQAYTQTWPLQFDTNGVAVANLIQAVFIGNPSLGFTNTVFFSPSQIVVQWQGLATNWPSGAFRTNYLYLTDNFGEVTNLQVAGNGLINPTAVWPTLTFMPVTYNFVQGFPFLGASSPPVSPASVNLGPGPVTNQYAAYEAIFTSGAQLPTDVAGGNVTNMAGRIEITADNTLNLSRTRISALNYLLLRATNHFVSSDLAQISAPNLDLFLRTTNGVLAVTNLVAPYLNDLDGAIDLWSARWTNQVNFLTPSGTNTVTNSYHVLVVNSAVRPTLAPQVQTLNLTVTNSLAGGPRNLYLSDVLNVTGNLQLNAQSITITTNSQNNFTRVGQLNVLYPGILWPNVTPGLQFLTNWGVLTAPNAVFFGGSHTQPPFNTNLVNVPYLAFVNHGLVTNQASLIWANYFENNGVFQAGPGSFRLEQGVSALLTDGAAYAAGDISLGSSSLVVSNHSLEAGGALTLAATNYLDDGSLAANSAFGITNKNSWFAGNGINLPNLPAQASLLGTTITNATPGFQVVFNQWAGLDYGCNTNGFKTNAALGQLILDGGTDCLFEFAPVGPSNALYVDRLEFRGFVASNRSAGNYLSVQIDPHMKIYYGQAVAGAFDVSERLSGKNGGGFCWVSNYNDGFFSSTNVVYPDGSTNRLNFALVTSCDIDSNGNGTNNCADPAPIPIAVPPSSAALALSVDYTTQPALAARVTWRAFPSTTNWLYATTVPGATSAQLVTNFVFTGSCPAWVTVTDPIKSSSPRFYRVRVDPR